MDFNKQFALKDSHARHASKALRAGANALVIVAHPDDETIWLGGLMMTNPKARWTVFSLCRSKDTDRAPKFARVCKFYKAKSLITDLEDDGRLSIKQTVPIIKRLLIKNLRRKNWDYLFTHGPNGEYGHPRHRGVFQAVKQLLQNQTLKAGQAWSFCYQKNHPAKIYSTLRPAKNCDAIIKLPAKIYQQKRKIMIDLYGFAPDGPDTNYCAKSEGLKILK